MPEDGADGSGNGAAPGRSRLQLKQAFVPTGAHKRSAELNVLLDIPTDHMAQLTPDEMNTIWKHYDRPDLGYMLAKSKEIDRFATHVVDRIEAMYRTDYRKKHPNAAPASVEAAVDKERPYLMPGGGKDRIKNITDMRAFMFKGMDVNKDGKLTAQEFSTTWNTAFAKVFVTKKSSVGCSIA